MGSGRVTQPLDYSLAHGCRGRGRVAALTWGRAAGGARLRAREPEIRAAGAG